MKILQVNHSNLSNRACSRQVGFAAFLERVQRLSKIPSDEMDWKQCSSCMRTFMEKFQLMLPPEQIKSIMVNVRHDLRRDDFDWAVRLFNQIGNAESSVGAGVWGAIG
jgi:hypothetical protein